MRRGPKRRRKGRDADLPVAGGGDRLLAGARASLKPLVAYSVAKKGIDLSRFESDHRKVEVDINIAEGQKLLAQNIGSQTDCSVSLLSATMKPRFSASLKCEIGISPSTTWTQNEIIGMGATCEELAEASPGSPTTKF
jgi:hypothetical protein